MREEDEEANIINFSFQLYGLIIKVNKNNDRLKKNIVTYINYVTSL